MLGIPPPDPRASSGWGLCPKPPYTSPITNFWLRARFFNCYYVILCKLILRLAVVYGFLQAALFLNKFAHHWFKPSSLNEFLVTCQHQATASDLPFYDNFAPTKNSVSKFLMTSLHVICGLGLPPIKNPRYAYVQ